MNCGPALKQPALPADHQVLCSVCGTAQPVGNFGAGQLKKRHPRCRACAPNKFSNQKTAGSDSKRESRHGRDLAVQERAGIIYELRTQVPFELIPAQRDEHGRVIERACTYFADYTYRDLEHKLHVVDAKGMRTEKYRIKRKLMLYFHKIRIEEV